MIKLSQRLLALANFIKEDSKVVDIGCDHGLLSIYLVKECQVKKVITSDINSNALEQAKKNIKKVKLEDQIEVRLGDGLNVLQKHEVDTIVIAGMGHNKIVDILTLKKDKLASINNIIIQSNTSTPLIRRVICKLGFYIEDEQLVKEERKIYTIVSFKKGTKKYTQTDFLFGPSVPTRNKQLYRKLLNYDLINNMYVLAQLPKKCFIKKFKLKQYLKKLNKKLEQ